MTRARRSSNAKQYPRTARVNEILREVLAEALERMADLDERLGLLTITAVSCDPDLRHATVWMASLTADEEAALDDLRVRLQAELSRQVRLRRTPQLAFQVDPALVSGTRVEAILRDLRPDGDAAAGGDAAPGGDGVPGGDAAPGGDVGSGA